ncbi:myogenesis-regulating glycosidase isoform X2, partial [Biomphalaria glabrata]
NDDHLHEVDIWHTLNLNPTLFKMFRSRANEKDRGAEAGVNREVSVPLVKTQDGKEFDPK